MAREDEERQKDICCGCGKFKDIGLIVCWTCFKYRKDENNFKYFDGSLEQWLESIKVA